MADWIAEVEAEKATYAPVMRRSEPRPRMTEAEIKALVEKFTEVAMILRDADPDD